MYIEELHLKNLKCFEDLHIDFRDEHGKPRKWTVLVGDNGAGKSTVLQAAGVCLTGGHPMDSVPRSWMTHAWVRLGADRGKLTLRFAPGEGELLPHPAVGDTQVELSIGAPDSYSIKRGWTPVVLPPAGQGWFACAYGPYRGLGGVAATRPMQASGGQFATLFTGAAELTPASKWLQDAHYQSVGGSSEEMQCQGARRLGAMKRAIAALLPGVTSVSVSREEVSFDTQDGEIQPEGLSDGYRGVLAWLIDMLGHLSMAFPDAEDLLQCEGVVLVDEIDAHLHPSWQRKVISTLRETFPNLQFIVTTHSPLTVGGARDGEVVLLKREGDKVVAETDFDSVQGWRADQILTSDLFGLTSTRDAETERLLEERRALFAKGEQRTEEENRRFEELAVELQAFLPRPGDTPDERREQEHRRELTEWIERQIPEDELEGIKASLRDELRQRRAAREGARQE